MRLGPLPDNPIERLIVRLNVAPRPLLETQIAYTLARLIMAGTKLGVFEAVADGPADAEEIASRCGTSPVGTGKLLFALTGAGYLTLGDEGYSLTPVSRKWLLRESPHSMADKLLMQYLEWEWMGSAEEYVRTGEPLELHSMTDSDQWALYQRGMRAMANAWAPEVARRLPVPGDATAMLDIGGSHGYYSVALCRRHEELSAVILDLPAAVEQAAPLLAGEGMGDRVIHRAGDALADDLGTEEYDIVLIAQLAHHFSAEQNADLVRRVARALRPKGVCAILDSFRPETPKQAGQVGALLEFYFALTSQSGTWTEDEIVSWQRDAGLSTRRPIRLRTAPGVGIQVGVKGG